jgi:myosin-9
VKQYCGKEENKYNAVDGTWGHVFGAPLARLAEHEGKVPVVVDRLITSIELYGLYTEGLYRKSGVSSKVRELKARIEESIEDVVFENYQVSYSKYLFSFMLYLIFRKLNHCKILKRL